MFVEFGDHLSCPLSPVGTTCSLPGCDISLGHAVPTGLKRALGDIFCYKHAVPTELFRSKGVWDKGKNC